ncbi:nucleotidyltransferase family protein [Vreelandella piezotolerans]|uniref:Nucleotidyltransferase family protein n=1 Tax=Vreelandella piezotolerans TaxID=2609667 RepID=A0ABQ6X758_9GAMM|nr:nucleotidyltransferase family protein [Halomonas piezotolerans]KAE8437849.1 nucleotidyltransferase family protein [Halomonas piezotolerans]QJA25654.1 nucleotidyltransferase family protein [Halomonas piezotolerans]
MSANHVVALIMAAGYSRRYGEADKRQERLADGRTLLATTVARTEQAFSQVRVAIREEDDAFQLGLAASTPLLRLRQAHLGLGASLAEAVAALGGDCRLNDSKAVAVLLGDMPRIHPATLRALQQQATRDTIWRPRYGGQPGHPVLFGRAFWPELAHLRGETGAKSLIQRHPSHYHTHDVDDAGTLFDIDTPDALACL